ncbi:hypothetical protein ACLK1Y_11300 [Escherichia coli]
MISWPSSRTLFRFCRSCKKRAKAGDDHQPGRAGTDSFPQADFDGPHNLTTQIFASQGVVFDDVLICPHLPADSASAVSRKLSWWTAWLANEVMATLPTAT